MALPDLAVLADAGGYVIAVAALISVIYLIVSGKLVPGHVYERETRRADSLDATLDSVTDTLEDLTAHVADDPASTRERRRGAR